MESKTVESGQQPSVVVEEKAHPPNTKPHKNFYSLRGSYLVPRAVILSVVWAGIHFGLDPLMRIGLTQVGQSLNGARVDISEVETHLANTRMQISGVAVANSSQPGKNLFEFDSAELHLSPRPLLKRRFVIEQMRLEGLQFDTPRDDDGRLSDESVSDSQGGFDLTPMKEQLTAGVTHWLNDLADRTQAELDPQQLQTVQVSSELQVTWTRDLADYERRVRDLKVQLELIDEAGLQEGRLEERLQSLSRKTLETKKLVAEAARLRQEIAALPAMAQQDLTRLQDAKDQDLHAIQHRIDALKLDAETISRALLGQQTAQQLATVVEWSRRLQAIMGSNKEEVAISTRGATYDFSSPDNGPRLHAISIVLSGTLTIDGQPVPYTGEIRDLSSDPTRLNEPVRFQLVGTNSDTFQVVGLLDSRSNQAPLLEAQFNVCLPKPVSTSLTSERIALNVSSSNITLDGWCRLSGSDLEGRVNCQHPNLALYTEADATNKQSLLNSALSSALAEVRQANTSVIFQGQLESPKLWFESDLGETLSQSLRTGLQTALIPQQQKLKHDLQQLSGERSAELRQLIDNRLGTLTAQLNLQERKAGGLLERVAGRGGFNFGRVLR